jgi:hypothetical protein
MMEFKGKPTMTHDTLADLDRFLQKTGYLLHLYWRSESKSGKLFCATSKLK